MKKWFAILIVALVILVGAILLLPYSMGRIVQNNYLAMVNTVATPKYQLQVVSYKRGWFSADVILQAMVTIPTMYAPNWVTNNSSAGIERVKIIINQTIQHGPWLFAKDATGNKKLLFGQAFITSHLQQIQPIAVQAAAKQPANSGATQQVINMQTTPAVNINGADLTTFIHFNNLINNTLRISQVVYKNLAQQVTYNINNVAAETTVTPDLQTVNGNLTIAAIDIVTPTFNQQSTNIQMGYDLQKAALAFYVGKRHFQIANNIWTNTKTNDKVFFQNFVLKSDSQAQAGKVNFAIDMTLDHYGINTISYGPNELNLSMNNVDIPSFLMVRQQFADLTSQNSLSTLGIAKYNQLAFLLLSKGMSITLQKLAIASPWGTPDIKANLVFPPQAQATANPLVLLSRMQAEIDLQLPVTLVEEILTRFNTWSQSHKPAAVNGQPLVDPKQQAQQQVQQWIKNNWLIAQGNSYQVKLTYNNQQALLNGKPFAISNVTSTPSDNSNATATAVIPAPTTIAQ